MRSRSRLTRSLLTFAAGMTALGLIPAQAPQIQPGRAAVMPIAALSSAHTYQRYRVVGVRTREQRSAIVATGAAIEAVAPDHVIVTATPEQRRQMAALGFLLQPAQPPTHFPPADAGYHNYDEMVAEIQATAPAHPSIVQLFSIGTSYEGRDLLAAKISDNAAQDEDEPEALFVGLYHAREHLTLEMLLYI